MHIQTLRTPGLGDTTYVLTHHGLAIVVDPQRDIERFLHAARDVGADISFVLETHVHNDYVSGGRVLLEDLPADAGLVIRPVHTPSHTPEHVSYFIMLDGHPAALFSGGSLLVGSAGRTDLLGAPRARQLARLQYGSVYRLAQLPDEVSLFPTHGAGSFCTASEAEQTSSSIGAENRSNPVLAHRDAEAFADAQLANLQPYPRYYALMAPINVLGPRPLPTTNTPELSPAEIGALESEMHVIDARPRAAFAAGHLPGSIGIELAEDFATWAGWLLPFDAPVVLVLEPGQDVTRARD